MGCKRKIWFTKDGTTLQFDSFADARRYFGSRTGNFPDYAVKSGKYKGWKVEAGESPYHGMHGTPLYRSWAGMKTRCTNPNIPEWKDYGGRGIKLCDEWMEFIPFMEWAKANGHKEGLTIERIDVNGDYCPENCCWITKTEQQSNKRNSRAYTVGGERKILASLAKEHGLSQTTIQHRLDLGWSIDDALTRKRKTWPTARMITYDGRTKSLRQWGKATGLNPGVIARRIDHGWSIQDALTTPADRRNRKQTIKISWTRRQLID